MWDACNKLGSSHIFFTQNFRICQWEFTQTAALIGLSMPVVTAGEVCRG